MNSYDFEYYTQSARNANLADYFLKSGYTTEPFGFEIYIKEFPGLCVNKQTNKWYSHYEGEGGSNAIDCLVKICGRDFKQAVRELTGQDVGCISNRITVSEAKELLGADYVKLSPPEKTEPPNITKKGLQMPERAENMRRVFAYFCKERNVPAAIVEELIHAKLLYQSQHEIKTTVDGIPQTFRTCNAVFVHKDKDGVVVGGEVQGVNSYKRYKGIVAGTGNSVFLYTPFPVRSGKIKTAYLFESAVDLMSFYAFCKPEKLNGVALISMAGLKPSVPKQLQAQGVKVLSCVDNDDKGRKFEKDNGFKRLGNMLEKAGVKDWSELLKLKTENPDLVKSVAPEIEIKKFFTRRK